jgi:uracil-DNA glycosylase
MSEVLQQIAQEVRACTKCRLHETAKNGVPGAGSSRADVLLVGEGPGYHEDVQGKPFVGNAGKLLSDLLARAGLSRDEVFITNIVKHRPPGNRDPLPDEKAACVEYLERQIAEVQPKLIVTLGRHSMTTFFGPTAKISQVHGTTKEWRGILAYACFHPAAALHQPRFKELLEQDFDGLPQALERARELAARSGGPGVSPTGETMPEAVAEQETEAERPNGEQLSLF